MRKVLQVSIQVAGSHLPQLAEHVRKGEKVVITREGRPYVELISYAPVLEQRKPGRLKGRIQFHQDFDALSDEISEAFVVGSY
ncbi:type II toxin-antitoxin system Phd/YefM family antitoxin [Pseudomonas sp. nanlin1]|uniref:type II toxin-antitoxin system Phd/YefM family antitoxin n=1 Tax=Pseudomonas sp. nanlin1 TaxID=3040605 RepID=UPI00388E7222